jgi:hypothetical protein
MIFFPRDGAARESVREILAEELARQEIELLTWRAVPVDPSVLGDKARDTQPAIEQVIVQPKGQLDELEYERRLFLARKASERRADEAGIHDYYVPSFSCRTVVYKGLFVAPQVRESTTALAEYARVLRPGGLLSTMTRTYDESIPWMRKLHAVIGRRPGGQPSVDTLTASGLFADPETDEFGTWEELDLAGALRFAAEVKGPTEGDEIFPAVRDLFTSYASQSGTLRMRHQTHCLRARVNRENLLEEPTPDTTLLDLA